MFDPAAFKRFCESELRNERGQPVQVLPFWMEVAAGLRDKLTAAVALKRQQGKSLLASCLASWLLFNRPDAFVLFIAASERQARSILEQKLKRPILGNPRLARDARVLESRVEVPAMGSVLEVVAASEDTSPGRSVDLLIGDEARELSDELFMRLTPSTVAREGRVLLISTPGPPRGIFHQLVTDPSPETFVYWSGETLNPHTSERHLQEAAGLSRYFPGLYQREFEARFADLGSEFITRERLDRCVDPALENRSGSSLPCFAFLDLSRKRDLTSLVVVARERAQEDESERLVVVSIQTWDPRRFPGGELDFGVIRSAVAELFEGFKVVTLGVDDRHEAAELLAWMRRQRWGGVVQPVAATSESNMQMWGALAERIAAGTIRLPPHKRLVDELLSLKVEDLAAGRAWRVTDGSKRLHRDVSMALAGAVMLASQRKTSGTVVVDTLSWEEVEDAKSDPESIISILSHTF